MIIMLDYDTAFWSVMGVVTALIMFFFSLRLSMMFRGGKIVKGWIAFAISATILTVISLVSMLQSLTLLQLPSWWREISAFIFRISLIYALYEVYSAWTGLTKKTN